MRVALVLSVLAAAAFVVWLFLPPGPAPLPPGATRLELHTQPAGFGSRIVLGCPAAVFPDMVLMRSSQSLRFRWIAGYGGAEDSNGPTTWVEPVWPPGWSARLVDDRAELVNPDGAVVAREHDVIRHPAGGNGQVCLSVGSRLAVETAGPTIGPGPMVP